MTASTGAPDPSIHRPLSTKGTRTPAALPLKKKEQGRIQRERKLGEQNDAGPRIRRRAVEISLFGNLPTAMKTLTVNDSAVGGMHIKSRLLELFRLGLVVGLAFAIGLVACRAFLKTPITDPMANEREGQNEL